jgi:putative transposase
MPRKPRVDVPGGLYHLTSRGCARCDIYRGDPTRELHLALLAQVVAEYGWLCHAYCQMNNHFHLLVRTPDPNLSEGMQFLNGTYAQAFNKRFHRTGHLFQGRFHSVVIDREEQLLETARYVVLNRVRCRASKTADEWPWSSYRATAGLAPRPAFLTTDWILARFGEPGSSRSRDRYRDFVAEGSPASSLRALLAMTPVGVCPGQTPGPTALPGLRWNDAPPSAGSLGAAPQDQSRRARVEGRAVVPVPELRTRDEDDD